MAYDGTSESTDFSIDEGSGRVLMASNRRQVIGGCNVEASSGDLDRFLLEPICCLDPSPRPFARWTDANT